MSQRPPALRPQQVVRALERAGWEVIRQKGSHMSLRKDGVPFVVTVPLHNRNLPRGTLQGILRDAGLTMAELFA